MKNTTGRLAPSVSAASSSRWSTASSAKRIARTIRGKPITPAGEGRAGPTKRKDQPEIGSEACPDRPAPAEGEEQGIARHYRRQYERQMDDAVEQRPSGKSFSRER